MNTTALNNGLFNRSMNFFRLLFQRPARRQLAALCYRKGEAGPEVLLITSRNTKRWIIPKGWPMADLSARKTAKLEAFEEAGIVGKVGKQPIGEYRSMKGIGRGMKVRTNIVVYPLKVDEQVSDFPESGQRQVVWLTPDQAVNRCQEDGLRHLLESPQVKSLLMETK
jgi:8-oxo-dGTP pyrophosphatase MutT (NUDIX family)